MNLKVKEAEDFIPIECRRSELVIDPFSKANPQVIAGLTALYKGLEIIKLKDHGWQVYKVKLHAVVKCDDLMVFQFSLGDEQPTMGTVYEAQKNWSINSNKGTCDIEEVKKELSRKMMYSKIGAMLKKEKNIQELMKEIKYWTRAMGRNRRHSVSIHQGGKVVMA